MGRAGLLLLAMLSSGCAARLVQVDLAVPATAEVRAATPLHGRGDKVQWQPQWPEFHKAEYVVTGLAVGTVLTTRIIGPRGSPRRFDLLIDGQARDALRIGKKRGQEAARDVSDIFLTLLSSYPILGDALLNAAWYRDSPEVATQMAMIDMQTLAVTLALQSTLNVLVSRERPFGDRCGTSFLPESTRDCASSNRYYSYFSGHTSTAFASAGLICSHHLNLPLHGGGAKEWIPCATGFLLAGMTGTLRVAADMHYLSDVLTGALVGTLTGLGLPWLLHYRFGPKGKTPVEVDAEGPTIMLVPMNLGLGVVGWF